uniref:Probable RNA-binding protein 18 n=1 Tax=Ornithorhynchus anatinus TaxID=9258 RepID=A0A6I8PIT6_ORNAN
MQAGRGLRRSPPINPHLPPPHNTPTSSSLRPPPTHTPTYTHPHCLSLFLLPNYPPQDFPLSFKGSLQEGHRLWIGNLDPKITEYHLLKLLQKFGKVKQFDFLFHKSGALEGQPRGYCFVNFETKQEAEQAIQCLNGKLALSKKLVVRWAHAQIKRYDHNKNDKILPISLEPSSSTEPTQSNLSVSAKIKAIEAKLKMMAENPDAEYPAAPVYSYFKPPDKKRTTPYSRTAWKSRR